MMNSPQLYTFSEYINIIKKIPNDETLLLKIKSLTEDERKVCLMAINNTFKAENLDEKGLKTLKNAFEKFSVESFKNVKQNIGVFAQIVKHIQSFIKGLQNYFSGRISSQTLLKEIRLCKNKFDKLDMIHDCDQFYIPETKALITILEFLETKSKQSDPSIDIRKAVSHVLCRRYQKLNNQMKEASNHHQQVFYFMMNHVIADLVKSSENSEDEVFYKNLSETREFLETKLNWDIKVRHQLQKELNDFSTKG